MVELLCVASFGLGLEVLQLLLFLVEVARSQAVIFVFLEKAQPLSVGRLRALFVVWRAF